MRDWVFIIGFLVILAIGDIFLIRQFERLVKAAEKIAFPDRFIVMPEGTPMPKPKDRIILTGGPGDIQGATKLDMTPFIKQLDRDYPIQKDVPLISADLLEKREDADRHLKRMAYKTLNPDLQVKREPIPEMTANDEPKFCEDQTFSYNSIRPPIHCQRLEGHDGPHLFTLPRPYKKPYAQVPQGKGEEDAIFTDVLPLFGEGE